MDIKLKEVDPNGPRSETFFILNLILCIVYCVPAFLLLYKYKLDLDKSALFNIAIYTLSFFIRVVMWAIADPLPQIEGWMTLLEYVAAFVIQISIYFFVFEMMSVRQLLHSQNAQENLQRQLQVKRFRMIASIMQLISFVGLIIYYYEWYIVEGNGTGKDNFELGFQIFKFISFVVDTAVLLLFITLLRYFVKVKVRYQVESEQAGLNNKQKYVILWIIVLITLNFFFLFFKCFMRTISIIIDNGRAEDKDILDVAHDYRFFLFSTVDILNGLSILYCFKCISEVNQQRQIKKQKQKAFLSQTSKSPNSKIIHDYKAPDDAATDGYNTLKIKQILLQSDDDFKLNFRKQSTNPHGSVEPHHFNRHSINRDKQPDPGSVLQSTMQVHHSTDSQYSQQHHLNPMFKTLSTPEAEENLDSSMDSDDSQTQFRYFLHSQIAIAKKQHQQFLQKNKPKQPQGRLISKKSEALLSYQSLSGAQSGSATLNKSPYQ